MAYTNSDSVQDRVAFITGTASGIGKATSELFMRKQAKTFNVDISFENGKGVERSGDHVDFGADLTSSTQVKAALDSCVDRFHKIDLIINCAGVEMRGTVVELSEASFDRVIDTNVKSIFLVCKYGIPLLLQNSPVRSSVINLGSDLGIQPIPGVDAYAASKGAIIALTKAMSKNWAKSGLRVNCVVPGPVDTPLLRRFLDEKSIGFVKEVMLPQGRLGTPEEVASVIAFLASDEASLINGAIVTVNGGLVG